MNEHNKISEVNHPKCEIIPRKETDVLLDRTLKEKE
jgi:hypothetical protein